MKFGYVRVSKKEQDLLRQMEALKGEECDRIFKDHYTGKTKKRPQLMALLDQLREGDLVVVKDVFRFGRSLIDNVLIVDEIAQKGANIKFLDIDIDTSKPYGKLIFHFLSSLAQMQREQISQDTKEALRAKKAQGIKLGRPSGLSRKAKNSITLIKKYVEEGGYTNKQIMKMVGISESSFYRYHRQIKKASK